MNSNEVIEDAQNNPFINPNGQLREWNANGSEVADTQVHNHIRTTIARLNFYLRHPLLGEEMDEEHAIHLRSELRRYMAYLNKAHYN